MKNFTELAYLGDLSNYSLDQLKKKLSRWEFELINISVDYFEVRFSEKVVTIDIRYTTKGEFVQILQEEWKGLD